MLAHHVPAPSLARTLGPRSRSYEPGAAMEGTAPVMIQSVFRERYILLAPPGSSSRPAGTVLPGVLVYTVYCLLQEPHWP